MTCQTSIIFASLLEKISVRSTGDGDPSGWSSDTKASPTFNSVIAVATSTPGLAREQSIVGIARGQLLGYTRRLAVCGGQDHQALHRLDIPLAGDELVRQAGSALYHITTAIFMAVEGVRLAPEYRRLALAHLVLRHKLLPVDPLALPESDDAPLFEALVKQREVSLALAMQALPAGDAQ